SDGAAAPDRAPASYADALKFTASTSECFLFTAWTIRVRAFRMRTSSPPDRSTSGAGAARCHATVVFFAATGQHYRPPGTQVPATSPSRVSSAERTRLPQRSVLSTGTEPNASSAFCVGWPYVLSAPTDTTPTRGREARKNAGEVSALP